MSHRYLADPGSLVYDGRVYLYTSNDDDNAVGGGYSMHSIVCVSTSDMKNWTDHGIVFQVPANASWAQNSWAPQAVARDGTVYLYFGNSGSGVGVASSTNPTGKFMDAKGRVLVDGSTPGASGTNSWLFDPGALIDDDGQAYVSFGGNGETNARIIKLGKDLVSVSGSATALAPKGFYEASFLFKRNALYYFAYSTDPSHGLRIDYLMSSSPMSGYSYAGVIADQPPVNNDNNHASQFVFNGKWYHAYHNRSVSTAAGISTTYKRNLALETLDFNADGTIQKVTYTTDGVPQVGHLDPFTRVEGETMNAQSGIETESCSEGGMDVTSIDDGDWIRVRGVDFGNVGAKRFSARVASTRSGGSIELRLGSATGMLIGKCDVPTSGGAQSWVTTTCDITGATGVSDLLLTFRGTGSQIFSLNYWQFSAESSGGGAGGAGAGGAAAGGAAANGGVANSGGGTAGAATQGGSSGGGGRGGGAAGTASHESGGSAGSSPMPGVGGGSGGTLQSSAGAGGRIDSVSSGGAPRADGGSAGTLNVAGSGGTTAGASNQPSQNGSGAGCSCNAVGGRGQGAGLAGLGFAMLALSRRRRSSN